VHEVAPKVKLCINDYNIESVAEKSIAYAQLAKRLLDKGAPLHCIGQSAYSGLKFDTSRAKDSFSTWRIFGLRIHGRFFCGPFLSD